MAQDKKILTVSYGTFSCTLEGFDDSFDAMKTVAEYFRGLAAEDRFFGAEPPQPEAEQTPRLPAMDGNSPVSPASTAETSAPVALDATSFMSQRNPRPVRMVRAADLPDGSDIASTDSVSVKLQRIRAVVARNETALPNGYCEDEHADVFDTTAEVFEDEGVEAGPEPGLADVAQEEILATSASDLPPKTESPESGEKMAADPNENPESVANPEVGKKFEPENEPAAMDLPSAVSVGEDHEPVAASECLLLTPTDLVDPIVTDTPEDETAQADGKDHGDGATVAPESVQPFTITTNNAESIDVGGSAAASDEDEDSILTSVLAYENPSDEDASECRDGDIIEAASSSATSSSLNESTTIDEKLDAAMSVAEPAIRPEKTADSPSDQAREEDPAKDGLLHLADRSESQMDTEEAELSQDPVTHLGTPAEIEKGTTGTEDQDDDVGQDAYCQDLGEVIRPRRPSGSSSRQDRPVQTDRPAPLKLVLEQRVDLETERAAIGPVRPRRVSSPDPAEVEDPEDQEGFAAYAVKQGATELPHLLEAAAAYISYVEGKPHFSRPLLMKTARRVKSCEFNREEGLQSFGKLVRTGKIEKAGGGRFVASTQIDFRPDSSRMI